MNELDAFNIDIKRVDMETQAKLPHTTVPPVTLSNIDKLLVTRSNGRSLPFLKIY